MAASEAVVRAVEKDWRVSGFLRKEHRPALQASFDQMGSDEELRASGIASFAGARGAGSTDTYYLITNKGTYFCQARKTGFMKRELVPQFVPHVEIARSDYINDEAVILRCYRGGEEDHFLGISFFRPDEQAELAKAAAAMGQSPVDVTYEVIPAARYRR
jgi:hypothetical protein